MPTDFSVNRPPASLAGWVALFDDTALPILAETADALEGLRANEDAVDARVLCEYVGDDPLMTIKVLAHVARLRSQRDRGEAETVTEALVMLGISPFFRAFGPQLRAEEVLAADPDALAGFDRVLSRARRAARFATGFAVHRMDHDAAVIFEAALLHDFAELLLWLKAPTLAQVIEERKRADPTLRSTIVQREVLHIELGHLEHALMQKWRLPSLVVQITDEHAPIPTDQVRNVQLAIRIARHSALGWDNPALPDDIRDVALLLNVSAASAERLLHDIDSD
jgi:HD-like signal output (HDOD) protein